MSQEDKFAKFESEKYWARAHRRAMLDQVIALVKQCPIELLPFEEVRSRLHLHQSLDRGVQQIQVSRILGSVGRYRDFTFNFMPREEHMKQRWEGVEQHVTAVGSPPIEVYQVGEAFFVLDGNHRVSVARVLGQEIIDAHVWEFPTRSGLSADANMDEVLAKAEYIDFLDKTHFDELDPDEPIELTCAGCYNELYKQISAYQRRLNPVEPDAEPDKQTVQSWYEDVYSPAIEIICQSGVIDDFPGRTAADLFVWVWQNHQDLEKLEFAEIDLASEVRGRGESGLFVRLQSWFMRK
ncbi:MAG: hypothetical protein J5I90_11665 [Caldilineales bacterium]|nr:hypothetical protein [Caldilineales bacterium]